MESNKFRFLKFLLLSCLFLSLSVIIAYSNILPDFKQKEDSSRLACKDCNIVWILIDTLRADAIHSYGNERSITPTIDFFADNGFKFTKAITVAPWTLPSAMSYFTGVYPSTHKILNEYTILPNGAKVISSPETIGVPLITLPQIFRTNGYLTAGFTGGASLERIFGFAKGFETYKDDKVFAGFEKTLPEAESWINEHKDKKFFVFIHAYDVHGQHFPPGGLDKRFVGPDNQSSLTGLPPELKSMRENALETGKADITQEDVDFLKAVYYEKVQRADEAFGNFIEKYKAMGLFDKTIFIVSADHGEEFYEHQKMDHGYSLYDELLRIPLIIYVPGQIPRTIPSQVRTIDFAPTVLDLAGITYPDNLFEGTSLIPLMNGRKLKLDVYPETDYRYHIFLRGIRTSDNLKYVLNLETGEEEFYDLAKDPLETRNLIDAFPKKMKVIKDKVLNHFQITNPGK